MTYSLPESIKYISCPVILIIDNQELRSDNGTLAIEQKFDKYYLIDEMFVRGSEIAIRLKVNDHINSTNWCGEEQVSFF